MFSKKPRVSLAKRLGLTGTPRVKLDLGHRIAIGRSRSKGYDDLILRVVRGSGGQGELGARAVAQVAEDGVPAVGLRRRTPIMVFRGLIRLGFWSGMAYASCVIHWWHQLGPGWLRGMDTAAVAVPSSGDAPVSGVWTSLGLGYVCKRSRGSPRCIPRERVELEVRAGSTATGGGDAARRSVHTEIPVQCRVGVGEEEVDGAPDSKAKPWRRLVVAERRRNSGTTAALSSVPAMARRRCWRSGL